jgi:hypothetical protein
MPVASYGVYEAINQDEYDNLKKKDQDKVNQIISASMVDMTPGSKAQKTLLEIFPEGTKTYEAIQELIGTPEVS